MSSDDGPWRALPPEPESWRMENGEGKMCLKGRYIRKRKRIDELTSPPKKYK